MNSGLLNFKVCALGQHTSQVRVYRDDEIMAGGRQLRRQISVSEQEVDKKAKT